MALGLVVAGHLHKSPPVARSRARHRDAGQLPLAALTAPFQGHPPPACSGHTRAPLPGAPAHSCGAWPPVLAPQQACRLTRVSGDAARTASARHTNPHLSPETRGKTSRGGCVTDDGSFTRGGGVVTRCRQLPGGGGSGGGGAPGPCPRHLLPWPPGTLARPPQWTECGEDKAPQTSTFLLPHGTAGSTRGTGRHAHPSSLRRSCQELLVGGGPPPGRQGEQRPRPSALSSVSLPRTLLPQLIVTYSHAIDPKGKCAISQRQKFTLEFKNTKKSKRKCKSNTHTPRTINDVCNVRKIVSLIITTM